MWNDKIFYYFYNFSHKSNLLDKVIIFTAEILPFILIIVAGVFLLVHHEVLFADKPIKAFAKKWQEITLIFFAGIVAWVAAYFLKIAVHSNRPFTNFPDTVQALFHQTGYAFPSGHSTFFMALGFAVFLSHKKAGYVFMFLALLIGLARIAAGVHYPVDILGGFILGTGIAFVVSYFYKLFHR